MHNYLAQRLPDLPRWVEIRHFLLQGNGDLFGVQETPEPSFVLRDRPSGFVGVVGAPDLGAIMAAVNADGPADLVVADARLSERLAAALPGWAISRLIFHSPGPALQLPEAPPGQVRLLQPGELDQLSIPPGLRVELQMGAAESPVAATFVAGQPVSFCYACAITESRWDIAIDTLSEHRRRGYAALCVTHMIRHMRSLGKEPVWQSVGENPASWRLARKLGFIPVDEMVLICPVAGREEREKERSLLGS